MSQATEQIASTKGGRVLPILKWTGGKRRLVPEILELVGDDWWTYHEPFAGGAAVFFALASISRTYEGRRSEYWISDTNRWLTDTYTAVRDEPERVIAELEPLAEHHSERQFYAVRDVEPGSLTMAKRAAQLIYLNKTCFNGLFRVNRAGNFNVPFGRYEDPQICDAGAIGLASAALRGVRILCEDFSRVVHHVRRGDVVYLDPPYLPLDVTKGKTRSFTAYTEQPFGLAEHERLRDLAVDLSRMGVRVVASASSSDESRKIWARPGFEVREVEQRRLVGASGDARAVVRELLILRRAER
jgi:DNA adenine methylase